MACRDRAIREMAATAICTQVPVCLHPGVDSLTSVCRYAYNLRSIRRLRIH